MIKISFPEFKVSVHVEIGSSDKWINRNYYPLDPKKAHQEVDPSVVGAVTTAMHRDIKNHKNTICVHMFEECISPGLIAHECMHVAQCILDHIGLCSDGVTEIHTYLTEYMIDQIFLYIKLDPMSSSTNMLLEKKRRGKVEE